MNIKLAFEKSIIQLSKTLNGHQLQHLDFILIQEKKEEDLLNDIFTAFPNFSKILVTSLKDNHNL